MENPLYTPATAARRQAESSGEGSSDRQESIHGRGLEGKLHLLTAQRQLTVSGWQDFTGQLEERLAGLPKKTSKKADLDLPPRPHSAQRARMEARRTRGSPLGEIARLTSKERSEEKEVNPGEVTENRASTVTNRTAKIDIMGKKGGTSVDSFLKSRTRFHGTKHSFSDEHLAVSDQEVYRKGRSRMWSEIDGQDPSGYRSLEGSRGSRFSGPMPSSQVDDWSEQTPVTETLLNQSFRRLPETDESAAPVTEALFRKKDLLRPSLDRSSADLFPDWPEDDIFGRESLHEARTSHRYLAPRKDAFGGGSGRWSVRRSTTEPTSRDHGL